MSKDTDVIIGFFFKKYLLIILMGSIGCSCSMRLIPTYILPAIEMRLLG